MPNFNQLAAQQFIQPAALETVKKEADELIDHLMAPEAYQMALKLEQKLKELAALEVSQPQIFAQYKKILTQLKFISLAIWDNDTFLDLIKNNLGDILGTEIDINERMTGKFYTIPDLAWPEIAQQTIEVLKQNLQPLGTQPLNITGEPTARPSLIKYWVLDYERTMGAQRHENLQRAQYFTQSRNFQNLTEADKTKVRQLLEFYDNLKPLPLPEEVTPAEEGELQPLVAPIRQKAGEEAYFETEEATPPPAPSPPSQPSPPRPSPPPVTPPTRPTPKDVYREKVEPEDVAGPQVAQRPEPKLNGNIVDLKNINNRFHTDE